MGGYVHRSVMLEEVVAALGPRPGGRYLDATLGGGGHAEAILEASSPSGWLYGMDRDEVAVAAAGERLARFAGRFELRQGSFAELGDWIAAGSCDGVLFDLGVSSPQLDWAERGFSFQQDGPLDMRMDRRQRLTAADLVNEASRDELARIFLGLGEEHEAKRLARAIDGERLKQRFETTRQLASLIERVKPRRGARVHPATKVFQALRMAVNDELGALRAGLAAALEAVKPGGRIAVITFHSVEDRVVKEFGKVQAREYDYAGEVDVPELRRPRAARLRWVERKALVAGVAELADNPRSRSARLRVMERLI
ncbi:MAG: 16S rRNA (cytosine(1402)-N(4))-methyltransferase RsmH [Verrucomicrobia bacterium]|nr:16S rRNA (cytosine(1402)-N(4))-methyltransferase RsmH [Verrucomicrobiota bacterium]